MRRNQASGFRIQGDGAFRCPGRTPAAKRDAREVATLPISEAPSQRDAREGVGATLAVARTGSQRDATQPPFGHGDTYLSVDTTRFVESKHTE
jgi:hypothetical protein